MNLYDVIKKPVITESSMAQLEAGKYVFEVDTRAHKLLIKQAVEAAFVIEIGRASCRERV